jgi:peptide/nickel transport system permease protein
MSGYVARRLALMLPTLLLASVVVFIVMRALPGDVAATILSGSGEAPHNIEARQRLREELGLDRQLVVQYGRWLGSIATSEPGGRSLITREPVVKLIGRQLPVTALLALYVMAISVAIALPLGAVAAASRGRWLDHAVRVLTVAGLALPHVWLGVLVILGLLLVFGWSPPVVYAHPWTSLPTHLQTMAGPVFVLGLEAVSHITRAFRANVLDAMGQDYMTTARAKGLPERTVVLRHGLPNALIPTATVAGLHFGTLLGGVVVVETVFGLPGLGRGLVQAALLRDYPVVQALVTLLVGLMLVINLVLDLLYARIDPRIRYGA